MNLISSFPVSVYLAARPLKFSRNNRLVYMLSSYNVANIEARQLNDKTRQQLDCRATPAVDFISAHEPDMRASLVAAAGHPN